MFIAYVVIAVLTSTVLVFSGAGKLRHDQRIVAVINEVVGVPLRWFPFLAACELAAAVGLLIGIAWAPVGIAAAVGVIAYFIGAIISHLRVRDFKGIGTPVVPLLLGVGALVTRILSS